MNKKNNLIKNLNWVKIKTLDKTEYFVKCLLNLGFEINSEKRISVAAYPIIYIADKIIYPAWSFLEYKNDKEYQELYTDELQNIIEGNKELSINYKTTNISTDDLIRALRGRGYHIKLTKRKN